MRGESLLKLDKASKGQVLALSLSMQKNVQMVQLIECVDMLMRMSPVVCVTLPYPKFPLIKSDL